MDADRVKQLIYGCGPRETADIWMRMLIYGCGPRETADIWMYAAQHGKNGCGPRGDDGCGPWTNIKLSDIWMRPPADYGCGTTAVLDESRSFFRVHTGYFSNIPKCIKAEFIASWACSQSSVVSSSKR
ncbi:hypothetical protein TNCV_4054961 [Trichonephila clavipes]|nr:hypothetical protein TNCV_4054961 [Trichonephila clavipes]